MRLRKLNNIIHRDFGYFFAGTTIIYSLSGLAVNHVDDWNPNFVIKRRNIPITSPRDSDAITTDWVMSLLEPLGEQDHYRSHDFPSPKKVKIYLDEGSVFVDLGTQQGVYETVTRRPLFYQINFLHLSPKTYWLVFSDIFAVSLIVICLTGLFVLSGKQGITGRGAWFAGAGLLVPLLFLLAV